LSARRGFGWSSSSTDASSAQATEFQPQEKPDRGRALSQSFDDGVDLLLLTGLVVALLTALTRLLRLLAGLLILPALLLTALARVLRLLTRLLIVAALILLAALARIVH
jgi:hypothetical protein